MLRNFFGTVKYFFTLVLPCIGNFRQEFHHSRSAPAIVFGEIGTGKKGLFIRRHDNRHGPSAAARKRLGDGHVHLVDIGPLLTVDFNADEILIEQFRHLFIRKGLVLHDMAPVTGGIPD